MSATTAIDVGNGVVPSPYGFKQSPYSSHSRLLESFPDSGDGLSVVDVGDGEGLLSHPLLDRGFRVVCVAQPGSVAPRGVVGTEVVEADLNRELPHLSKGHSHVLCGDVLEHLVDPEAVLIGGQQNAFVVRLPHYPEPQFAQHIRFAFGGFDNSSDIPRTRELYFLETPEGVRYFVLTRGR